MDARRAGFVGISIAVGDFGSSLPQPGSRRQPRLQQTPVSTPKTQSVFAAKGGAEVWSSGAESAAVFRGHAGAARTPPSRLPEATRRRSEDDDAGGQSQDLQVQSRRYLEKKKCQVGSAEIRYPNNEPISFNLASK